MEGQAMPLWMMLIYKSPASQPPAVRTPGVI
jgi:hypothetical protein